MTCLHVEGKEEKEPPDQTTPADTTSPLSPQKTTEVHKYTVWMFRHRHGAADERLSPGDGEDPPRERRLEAFINRRVAAETRASIPFINEAVVRLPFGK